VKACAVRALAGRGISEVILNVSWEGTENEMIREAVIVLDDGRAIEVTPEDGEPPFLELDDRGDWRP
jgi:hypothetical protein